MEPGASARRAASTIGTGEARRRPHRKTRRGGRPSRAQALALREHILEVAAGLFLTEGYGATSIEAVAERAGISKRTFYHRFDNKAALFAAVVHRIIEQMRPPPEVPLLEGATLQKILRRLAGLVLQAALSPQAIALHRLVIGESLRFPGLLRTVYEDGWAREATTLIGDLLARELGDPHLASEVRTFAALQFFNMLVFMPRRRSMGLGVPMTQAELDAWADNAVTLFLDGYRGLSAARTSGPRRRTRSPAGGRT